jgi:putative YhbY family RNA-binding protein
MKSLTPTERRALRAKAHHLEPVVIIGNAGLTPAVMHEIDVNLLAHELIKIRVFNDERAARDALLERICSELDAAAVQHIGKLLVVFRQRPTPAPPADEARRRKPDPARKAKDAVKEPRRPRAVPATSPREPTDNRRRRPTGVPRSPAPPRVRTSSRSR